MLNKIKIFGWRACQNILPTRDNLARRKIIEDDKCLLCTRCVESRIHVLWECGVEQDIWVGSLVKLQRYTLGQHDVVQLFQELLSRLHTTEFELFLVQAWLIWNQRIVMNHRRKLKDPKWLNKRAADYLDDFRQAQDLLQILETNMGTRVWQPPPNSMFELELCCCYFSRLKLLRCGCNGPQQEG